MKVLIESAWGRKGTTQSYPANFGFARSQMYTGHCVHHSTAAHMTFLHGDEESFSTSGRYTGYQL